MTKRDMAWLLAELANVEESRKGTNLSDDTLMAYREGRLTEAEAKRVEIILCHDSEKRARLAELAGTAMPMPSPDLKARVLRALPRRTYRRWLVAASLVAAVLVAGMLWLQSPAPLPENLAFDVTVHGEAVVRDASVRSATLSVAPTQELRLVVSPKETAVKGLEFGLYRSNKLYIERIPNDLLTVSVTRGVATLSGLASDLCGSASGPCTLWVVVARDGDLPVKRRLEPGREPGEVLADGSRRLVYPQTIEIKAEMP